MRQCLLRRGINFKVAWLPAAYAVKGNCLLLHDQNGWMVERVYGIYQAQVEVPHGYLSGGVWHR